MRFLLGFLLPAVFPVAAHGQQELIDLYYSAVEPELDAAVISEDLLLGAIDTFFAWNADVQAAGHYGELFEVDDGLTLIGQAVDFAIMQASADCVTNRDPGEAANILFLYSLAQLYPISLNDTDGELTSRYNTCARFRLTFHSVITTIQKKDQFISTMSGSVTLTPQDPETGIGMWEGEAAVLNHISMTSTIKARVKKCTQTLFGKDSALWVPGATIKITPTKFFKDADAKPAKPSASVNLAFDQVDEFFKIVCKGHSSTMMVVNFNMFFLLHKDQREKGLSFKFDHNEPWEALGNPYLSLGSTRSMRIKGTTVSEETLIEIFHEPQAYPE